MKRWITPTLAGVVCAGLLGPGVASAQSFQLGNYNRPQMQARPPVSPYLNLSRGGTGAGINYYGLVRPQLQTQQALQQFQTNLRGPITDTGTVLPPVAGGVPAEQVSTTGHPVVFFNYGRYFPGVGYRGVNAVSTGIGNTPGITPGLYMNR